MQWCPGGCLKWLEGGCEGLTAKDSRDRPVIFRVSSKGSQVRAVGIGVLVYSIEGSVATIFGAYLEDDESLE